MTLQNWANLAAILAFVVALGEFIYRYRRIEPKLQSLTTQVNHLDLKVNLNEGKTGIVGGEKSNIKGNQIEIK